MKYHFYFKLAAALIAAFFQVQTASAEPLRNIRGLDHPVAEEVVRVTGVKVILADYDAIRRDFPEVYGMNNDQIDEWILKYAAFISKAQASQSIVNTPIPTDGQTTTAYRPKQYGRALVFKTQNGLIDGKGAGSLIPSFKITNDNGNGLATAGEGVREFAYEKLIATLFHYGGSGHRTSPVYAVVQFPFSVKHPDGSTSPAGMILRQAHTRYPGPYSLFSPEKSLKVENELRKFGVTTAGAYREEKVEQINVQGTKDGSILDYGGFLAEQNFVKPIKRIFDKKILTKPGAKDFVIPDERLAVPFGIWGYSVTGKADPKQDNPWIWAHELTQHIADGTATRADAEQFMRNLIDPVKDRLERARAEGLLNCAVGRLRHELGN